MEEERIVILQETPLHPHSRLEQMKKAFEVPSILLITKRDGLRSYNHPPMFDKKYLVIFEDLKVFEGNRPYLRLNIMFVVVVCSTKSMVEDAKELCKEKSISYAVYENPFDKAAAEEMIQQLASVQVTKEFQKKLISRVGLSPQRIISAVMVLEQVGYTTSNITKYVDAYMFIDSMDVIAVLLGVQKSQAQYKRAHTYLHMNRLWFNTFTREKLLGDMEVLIRVYRDLISGELTSYNMNSYIEENRVSRRRVLYALDLLETKSLNELLAVQTFLTSATLLEVSMKLL